MKPLTLALLLCVSVAGCGNSVPEPKRELPGNVELVYEHDEALSWFRVFKLRDGDRTFYVAQSYQSIAITATEDK